MEDDFVDIVKQGLILAPCTLRCTESKVRGGRVRRTVSVTFRVTLLPPEVVEVLQAARFSAAYSPSQRVVRVKADPNGQFQLSKAPKAKDVYLLRFPHRDPMPWVEKRVPVEPDVNVEQKAVFLDIPGVTPERVKPAELALPAPMKALPAPGPLEEVDVPIKIPGTSVTLAPEEALMLSLLSAGQRYTKVELVSLLQREGHGRVSVNSVLGKIKYKLIDYGVEHVDSTDGSQVWLTPMATTALRRLIRTAEGVSR